MARRGTPWLLVADFAVLAIFIAGPGYRVWRGEIAYLRNDAERTLFALVHSQADHIATWLRGRAADAEVIHHDEPFGDTVARLRSSGDDPSPTARVRSYLDAIQRQHSYADAALVSPDGAELERSPRAPAGPLSNRARALVNKTLGSGRTSSSDLYLDAVGERRREMQGAPQGSM